MGPPARRINKILWLWVPAFASRSRGRQRRDVARTRPMADMANETRRKPRVYDRL